MNFCERLKEERVSRGLNQDAFSAIGKVTKRSQINYEKGDRVPDSNYLMNLLTIGVDVNYILTGNRNIENSIAQALTNAFLKSPDAIQEAVCKLLDVDLNNLKIDPNQNSNRTEISIGQIIKGDVINEKDVVFNFGIKKED